MVWPPVLCSGHPIILTRVEVKKILFENKSKLRINQEMQNPWTCDCTDNSSYTKKANEHKTIDRTKVPTT